jgi:hypothetical protein
MDFHIIVWTLVGIVGLRISSNGGRIGNLNHLFFWSELYRRTRELSISFLFDENPNVASASLGGVVVGGARSVSCGAAAIRFILNDLSSRNPLAKAARVLALADSERFHDVASRSAPARHGQLNASPNREIAAALVNYTV